MTPIRAVVAEDEALLRESVVAILRSADVDVVAQVSDVDGARDAIVSHQPDIAILDIRMPGPSGQDGLTVAREVRAAAPPTSVLLLSSQITTLHLAALLQDNAHGIGYLLKDRVASLRQFIDAVRRVAAGDCVMDPEVVAQLLRPVREDPLAALSSREREVLALVAEGHSNAAISDRLFLSPKTVEAHIRRVLHVLGIPVEPTLNRRVVAVLTYLNARDSPSS